MTAGTSAATRSMYCGRRSRPRVTNAAVEMIVSSSGATATYWPSGEA